MKKVLKVLPLGGLGEIGMNIMVIQYGKEAIIIDCGVMFSDENLPGIDLVIPDLEYVLNPDLDLKAAILTHGHEDHIGALPFLLRERNVPVYGSKFTLELVKKKLREYELLNKTKLNLIKEGNSVEVGPFQIEFIRMSHSIADALALSIRTPEGLIVHTGDFKIDLYPADGRTTDLERFKKLGDEGVFLLFSDSTNVEQPGHGASETSVRKDLERLIAESQGWTIIACFASHIPRLRQLFEIAKTLGKKVHLAGRTMVQNVAIGRELGYLTFPDNLFVELEDVPKIERENLIILSTGTQGEVRAALSRMALDQHKELRIRPKDRVIMSSRFIPGNERAIYSVIDHLYRRGAEVITAQGAEIHVSGHAYRADLKEMLEAVRPKYFIPVHGEYRHLVKHIEVAQEVGVSPEKAYLLEDGYGAEFHDGKGRRLPGIELNEAVLDGYDLVEMGSSVLRDRKHMSATGLVVAVLIVDRHSGELIQGPELFSKGVVSENEDEELINEAREELYDHLESLDGELRTNDLAVQDEIKSTIRKFFKNRLDRKPVVIPIVLEV